MTASFKIERLSMKDVDLLFEFKQRLMPDNSKWMDRPRWNWLYKENPFVDLTPVWVIKSNGRIVGSISGIVFKIHSGDESFTAYHGADFFVEEGFRGLPALRLFKKMASDGDLVVAANLSPDAKKLFLKMGFVDFSDHLYEAKVILSSGNYSFHRFLVKRLVQNFMKLGTRLIGYEASINKEIPDNYELLWKRIVKRREYGIEKSRSYLRWRYAQCPSIQYDFVSITLQGNLKCLAVASIITDNGTGGSNGLLFDLLLPENDFLALIAALSAIINYFKRKRCDSFQMHWNASWARPILKGLGFWITQSDLGWLVNTRKDNEKLQKLMNPGTWYFSLGDTDKY
ncbi:uncharacterized protein Dvar_37760 [Desulfosarcina variabilis str. Montpellier]|uniref:hypothetical protein n=1 Tax=Desulfosarcina variabilis TaxID=2300 RepID=UPI003AFB79AE